MSYHTGILIGMLQNLEKHARNARYASACQFCKPSSMVLYLFVSLISFLKFLCFGQKKKTKKLENTHLGLSIVLTITQQHILK